MTRKALIIIILLAVAGALFWVFNPARTHEVAAVKPVRTDAVQAVYATGTVEASLMIPIAPKVAARLMTLNVDEGARVEAGQVMAQLEDTDLLQNTADLQAKMELAQKDLTRAEKLSKSGAISKEGFDSAQAAFKSATASFERAKAELGYLQLIAPQAGTVIRRDGEIGELIPVGTSVFWINGGDQIRIETEVDEEDVGLVKPDQKVLISADAFPGQIFNGKVLAITPKGDPVARSYRVRVGIDGNAPMMIGMTAETNIITKEKNAVLMVPLSAVKEGKILKITNGKAVEIAVRTDIKTPQAVEITEGIAEGDIIAKQYDATLLEKGNVGAKITDWSPDKK
jgi:membrane fusion protein, multidrug efflux system